MASGFQLHVVNIYCPRPQPEVVTGLPRHTDYGVLTLLIQYEHGLQILHNGEWVPINPPPYYFLVNVADQLEVLLEFLCVHLHNQFDNIIISVNLFFALWSIIGLDTYYCLIFYGLTLIHLTDPLSQVIQIKCVMYIYIYIDVCAFLESILFSSLGEHSRQTYTHLHFELNFER